MALKFNRNYQLYADTVNSTLQVQQENVSNQVLIQPPFTIEFDVTRDNLATVNRANMTVYNLNLQTRTLLHKDAWETDKYRPIELWAGYGDSAPDLLQAAYQSSVQAAIARNNKKPFPRIFRGNITRAYSLRQGVNFLTKFECQDAGYAAVNSHFAQPYMKGTPIVKILEDLVNSMFQITVGAIGDFPDTLMKDESYEGDPKQICIDIMSKYGGKFSIDNEKAYFLKNDEYIQASVPILSDDNGIIGVPSKDLTNIRMDLIFEPGMVINQSVVLQTQTVPYYNGTYKVTGLSHRGIISPRVCGTMITSLVLTNLNPNARLVTQR